MGSAGRLGGVVALVTGGGSGIGRAVCVRLARDGARVAVADRDGGWAGEVREGLSPTPPPLHAAFAVDVASQDSVDAMVARVQDHFGTPPSICVTCAGVTRDEFLLRLPHSHFDEVLSVNLKGTFLVTQAVARAMVAVGAARGSIVHVGSIVGKVGNVGQANYAASKSGVEGLMRSCAKELGRFGIRCNAVLPGFIRTPMTARVPSKVIGKVPEALQEVTVISTPTAPHPPPGHRSRPHPPPTGPQERSGEPWVPDMLSSGDEDPPQPLLWVWVRRRRRWRSCPNTGTSSGSSCSDADEDGWTTTTTEGASLDDAATTADDDDDAEEAEAEAVPSGRPRGAASARRGVGTPCAQCGQSFRRPAALRRHRRLHRRLRPSPCARCGRVLMCRWALRDHQRRHCRPPRPPRQRRRFPCADCGKQLSSNAALVAHRRIHTGERPYGCPDCGKRFMAAKSLGKHRKSHSQRGLFACPDCGKKLTSKATLLSHRRIHSGERPYGCPDCGKRFMANKSLSKHRKSHAVAAALAIPGRAANATHAGQLCNHAPERSAQCRQSSACSAAPAEHPEDAMPHRCLQCGDAFRLRSVQLQHQKSHAVAAEVAIPGRAANATRAEHPCNHTPDPVQSSACSAAPAEHPEDAMPHRCLQCGDAFRLRSVQLQHQKSHAVAAAVAIPGRAANATRAEQICGRMPEQSAQCRQSSACSAAPAEHPEDAMPHHCLQCGDAFRLHSALLQHQKSHAVTAAVAIPGRAANATHAGQLCNHAPEMSAQCRQSSACSAAPAQHPEDAMPHRCLQCGDAFQLRSALLQHQKSHAIEGSNAANAAHAGQFCNHAPELSAQCRQSSACSAAPAEHPEDAMPHRCLQCGAAFRLRPALLQHQKSQAITAGVAIEGRAANATHAEQFCNHTPELNGGCKQSSACSSVPAEHPEDAMPHRCLQCGDAFRLHSALLQHQKSHAIEGSNASSAANAAHAEQFCNHAPELNGGCKQSSTCSSVPAEHPEDAMPHRCLQCGDAFQLHSALLQHQKSHTIAAGVAIEGGNAANATHAGQLCNHAPELSAQCRQSSACSAAPAEHPEDAMPHRCLQCGAAFRLHSALLQHQKSHAIEGSNASSAANAAHAEQLCKCMPELSAQCRQSSACGAAPAQHPKDAMPHRCLQCGAAFRLHSALLQHQKSHAGPRPHACTDCGKAFREATTLRRHRRIHTGEKPYGCPYCGKSFRASSTLIIHQRIHTGEKPYPCGSCAKSFVSSSSLMKHRRTHQRQAP